MSEKVILTLTLGIGILFILGGIWWAFAQYKECKNMGFSKFYCVQHAF